jgi:hypothetical protein
MKKIDTRKLRIATYDYGPPPQNRLLEMLAEDSNSTYALPFPCEYRDGGWRNPKSEKPLEAKIIGWRRMRGAMWPSIAATAALCSSETRG